MPPLTPPENPTELQHVTNAWETLLSSVYLKTQKQGTQDWFGGRTWQFTSTGLHTAVNVSSAEYINTTQLRELHNAAKNIIQIQPTNNVAYSNAIELEEEDLLSQRSGLHAALANEQSSQRLF